MGGVLYLAVPKRVFKYRVKRVPKAPFLFSHSLYDLFDNLDLFAIVKLPARGVEQFLGGAIV